MLEDRSGEWAVAERTARVARVYEARQEFTKSHSSRARQELITSPRQAYELIRTSLTGGLYKQGDRLEEAVLMRTLPATRSAVRDALQMLATEGLVRRRQNEGTHVSRLPILIRVNEYLGPNLEDPDLVRSMTLRKVSHGMLPTPEVVRIGLATDDPFVLCSERLMLVDDEPISLRVSYFPAWADHLPPLLPVTIYADVPPFKDRFEASFGATFGHSEVMVSTMSGESRTCGLLDVPAGSPLLMRSLRFFDSQGTVREISHSYYRGDRVTFVL